MKSVQESFTPVLHNRRSVYEFGVQECRGAAGECGCVDVYFWSEWRKEYGWERVQTDLELEMPVSRPG